MARPGLSTIYGQTERNFDGSTVIDNKEVYDERPRSPTRARTKLAAQIDAGRGGRISRLAGGASRGAGRVGGRNCAYDHPGAVAGCSAGVEFYVTGFAGC